MFQKSVRILLATIISLTTFPLFATTIGDVATNLMGTTELVTKLMIVTCYIVGLALIFVALAQYKIHRQSPKLVPLTTPIALLILGVIALLIPYASNMFGESASAVEQTKGQSQQNTILPMPGEANVPGLPKPTPRREAPAPSAEPQPQPQNVQPAPPPARKGGWTTEPQYQ